MSDLPLSAPGQKTGYRVQLAVFEGPLDLLLHLIEREELEITRISLARVTDQYLDYLEALEELQVDDLSDFIVVAARLILIKSQSLLPRPPTPSQSEGEDAGDALLRQLLAYKRFKEAARQLEERQAQGWRSYVRVAPPPRVEAGIEYLETVPLETLLAAARRTLQTARPAPQATSVILPLPMTMGEQIDLITRTLRQQLQTSFKGLLTTEYTRQEVAVTLLAMLELIKQQQIQARQERLFGEILILPV